MVSTSPVSENQSFSKKLFDTEVLSLKKHMDSIKSIYYTTYVRPILEYACNVWNPQLKGDIDSIESVQRYFTKKACQRCRIPFSSYSDRLKKLNMETLEYRRLYNDILFTYKLTHNLLNLNPYNTRRHKYQLHIQIPKNQREQHSFSNRIVGPWNRLPPSLFIPDCLNLFVHKLKQFDLRKVSDLRF